MSTGKRWLAVVCAVVAGGCRFETPAAGGVDEDVDAAVGADSSGSGGGGGEDAPAFDDPTAGIDWFTWPEQQPQIADAGYGVVLTDIARHLPASNGTQYWDADAITAGHETTHGIQAHLRNYLAPAGPRVNAFYVTGNRAAFVVEPNIRKSDIQTRVPANLRGPRYDLYLVQQTAWDDTPLYVFDEWNAYVNGAGVGIDEVAHGLYTAGWTDAVMGPLEFTAYAIATAKTVSEMDPSYFAANLQFRRFTAWEIQRAIGLYQSGAVLSQFAWGDQDAYAMRLREAPENADLRAFARATWGATWCQSVLGF